MSSEDPGRARRPAVALVLAGAWAAVVPYLGAALGVELDVPGAVEVADHVVPGAVVLLAAAIVLAGVRGARGVSPGDVAWSVPAALAFLAGFWVVSTHVPLVAEAADGVTGWDAALLHTSAGVPALAVGAAMLLAPFLAGGGSR